MPTDVDFGTYRGEWLEGFDSIHGTPATRGAHYQAGQFQAWDVSRYLSGDMAQAWQYVYRCGRKGSEQDAVTDLRKAVDFIEDWLAHDPEPNQRASTGDIPDEVFFTLDQWRLFALNDIQYADHNGAADTAESAVKTIKREIARREAA
ncbi:hypothetical protein CFR80_12325 [Komagataeibacter oboediens]|uniref:DUF3310 domain-containing protein n=1 Tax=Komagataeibacter oboediens TaxID=65958 RepID=A0A318QQN1_9PROT|nr:hypothetical protein CFR80_12325 [Komagataeibacter oboediens]